MQVWRKLVNIKKDEGTRHKKKSMAVQKDIYSKGDTTQEVGR